MTEDNVNGQQDAVPKKQRKKSRSGDSDVVLNINSIMDIMTILLVFLMVSITSDPLAIQQNDRLKLAKSTADYPPENSIPITVAADQILVDRKPVLKVECTTATGQQCQPQDYGELTNTYRIDKFHKKDQNDESPHIQTLFKKLEEVVKMKKEEDEAMQEEFKGIATCVVHSEIPFRILTEIVYTAGMAELSSLRFAVLKTSAR
jgi:biopolymer transport protein ExbD